MQTTKQFKYPDNKKQRSIYITMLRKVHQTHRVQYSLYELLDIIIDTLLIEGKSGPDGFTQLKHKRVKATQMLRDLLFFVKPYDLCLFNVCMYTPNGEQITDFNIFYDLCLSDDYMSDLELPLCGNNSLSKSSTIITDEERLEIRSMETAAIASDDDSVPLYIWTSSECCYGGTRETGDYR